MIVYLIDIEATDVSRRGAAKPEFQLLLRFRCCDDDREFELSLSEDQVLSLANPESFPPSDSPPMLPRRGQVFRLVLEPH